MSVDKIPSLCEDRTVDPPSRDKATVSRSLQDPHVDTFSLQLARWLGISAAQLMNHASELTPMLQKIASEGIKRSSHPQSNRRHDAPTFYFPVQAVSKPWICQTTPEGDVFFMNQDTLERTQQHPREAFWRDALALCVQTKSRTATSMCTNQSETSPRINPTIELPTPSIPTSTLCIHASSQRPAVASSTVSPVTSSTGTSTHRLDHSTACLVEPSELTLTRISDENGLDETYQGQALESSCVLEEFGPVRDGTTINRGAHPTTDPERILRHNVSDETFACVSSTESTEEPGRCGVVSESLPVEPHRMNVLRSQRSRASSTDRIRSQPTRRNSRNDTHSSEHGSDSGDVENERDCAPSTTLCEGDSGSLIFRPRVGLVWRLHSHPLASTSTLQLATEEESDGHEEARRSIPPQLVRKKGSRKQFIKGADATGNQNSTRHAPTAEVDLHHILPSRKFQHTQQICKSLEMFGTGTSRRRRRRHHMSPLLNGVQVSQNVMHPPVSSEHSRPSSTQLTREPVPGPQSTRFYPEPHHVTQNDTSKKSASAVECTPTTERLVPLSSRLPLHFTASPVPPFTSPPQSGKRRPHPIELLIQEEEDQFHAFHSQHASYPIDSAVSVNHVHLTPSADPHTQLVDSYMSTPPPPPPPSTMRSLGTRRRNLTHKQHGPAGPGVGSSRMQIPVASVPGANKIPILSTATPELVPHTYDSLDREDGDRVDDAPALGGCRRRLASNSSRAALDGTSRVNSAAFPSRDVYTRRGEGDCYEANKGGGDATPIPCRTTTSNECLDGATQSEAILRSDIMATSLSPVHSPGTLPVARSLLNLHTPTLSDIDAIFTPDVKHGSSTSIPIDLVLSMRYDEEDDRQTMAPPHRTNSHLLRLQGPTESDRVHTALKALEDMEHLVRDVLESLCWEVWDLTMRSIVHPALMRDTLHGSSSNSTEDKAEYVLLTGTNKFVPPGAETHARLSKSSWCRAGAVNDQGTRTEGSPVFTDGTHDFGLPSGLLCSTTATTTTVASTSTVGTYGPETSGGRTPCIRTRSTDACRHVNHKSDQTKRTESMMSSEEDDRATWLGTSVAEEEDDSPKRTSYDTYTSVNRESHGSTRLSSSAADLPRNNESAHVEVNQNRLQEMIKCVVQDVLNQRSALGKGSLSRNVNDTHPPHCQDPRLTGSLRKPGLQLQRDPGHFHAGLKSSHESEANVHEYAAESPCVMRWLEAWNQHQRRELVWRRDVLQCKILGHRTRDHPELHRRRSALNAERFILQTGVPYSLLYQHCLQNASVHANSCKTECCSLSSRSRSHPKAHRPQPGSMPCYRSGSAQDYPTCSEYTVSTKKKRTTRAIIGEWLPGEDRLVRRSRQLQRLFLRAERQLKAGSLEDPVPPRWERNPTPSVRLPTYV